MSLRHGEYDGTYFSAGTASLGEGSELELVYTETADGKFDLVGRIDGTIEFLGPLLGAMSIKLVPSDPIRVDLLSK